ncbi:hypothetical protein [Devosia lacusdianchii]|uniref:hypothetical protein n=1 Tax=Devosia lacusdianchii TaxID=2917991 RepID=UPI001F05684C|nr:hypothetical protein [Devosia sp. JXJ CY 41]
MKLLLAIAPTVLLVVYGQLMTKWRVGIMATALGDGRGIVSKLVVYLSDPLIVSAYASSFLASLAWVFVVERYEISLAFPVYIGLITAIVALGGAVLFQESLNPQKLLAIALIAVGVIIAANA